MLIQLALLMKDWYVRVKHARLMKTTTQQKKNLSAFVFVPDESHDSVVDSTFLFNWRCRRCVQGRPVPQGCSQPVPEAKIHYSKTEHIHECRYPLSMVLGKPGGTRTANTFSGRACPSAHSLSDGSNTVVASFVVAWRRWPPGE